MTASMWFHRANRRRVRAFVSHLEWATIERMPADARALARQLLEQHLSRGGLSETLPSGKRADLDALRTIVDDGVASPYVLLDAAVGLAILGEPAAIPTLRRVFDEWGFALTASCNEQGLAALGLALLGDTASIDRIRRGSMANFAGAAKPIALAILEGREPPDPAW